MFNLHFIRPYWFLAVIPLLVLTWRAFRRQPTQHAWSDVCDPHLLPYLIKTNKHQRHTQPLLILLACAQLMVISLTGPTWSRLPVPTFQQSQPRIIVLDMSNNMLVPNPPPSRLMRAKFKLHDLFQHKDVGQFGLVVYTAEPFVVSPLTDDGATIDALLPSLTQDLMPVKGNDLSLALTQAQALITQAGFHSGEILVMTALSPSESAIDTANELASSGVHTSIMPILRDSIPSDAFKQLAKAGQGYLIPFSDTESDLNQWIRRSHKPLREIIIQQQNIPVWRDQGRWFLLPALLLLLPVFRRGWLQRINS